MNVDEYRALIERDLREPEPNPKIEDPTRTHLGDGENCPCGHDHWKVTRDA